MLSEMKAYAHLKPGQDGTKRLVEQYGDRLLCVRYRFDETRGMKVKTVELIVDERPLTRPRFRDDELVPVRVGYGEAALREQLRGLRARWGVLITSISLPFPNFIIRPKSFTQEVGDMLGMREHFAAIPASLIDKYAVKSEDEGRFASKLTPEIVSMFLNNEDVSVEYLNGALLVTPALISEEKNYEPAVQLAHALALSLGVVIAKKASDS